MSDTSLPVPKTYLEKLLKPISRISESCVLKFSEDLLYTLCTPADNSLILYAAIKLPVKVESQKLNLINIKKLLTGFDCLGDDGEFSITLNRNYIRCEMFDSDTKDGVHFKYHLVDDGIIKESAVNIQKIAKLKFDTEFEIQPEKLKKIISAYSFASDASKIYFYSKDKKIYGEIDDKTIQNIDNLSLLISPKIIGEDLQNPLPINIEIFKNLSMTKNAVKVKINNEFNVFVFQVQEEENIELKYIVSALVK
jgi:hypothetical protein